MPVRLYTLEEANALLPLIRIRIEDAQRLHVRMKDAAAQMKDLQAIHGSAISDADHPDRAEFRTHKKEFETARSELGEVLAEFARLGVEVKDLDIGLVDLHADRAGEIVYLCWKQGEETIEHWHTLDGGFAGRRKLGSIQDLTPSV